MQKKKIIIDLDVVTIAEWDSHKDSIALLNRVKFGEFEVYTPYSLLDLLDKWHHKKLREKIKEFYELYSAEIVTAQKLTDKLDKLGVKENDIVNDLKKEQVKEEDILLVVVTSVFDLDYLITFNRKHLKNKKEVINNVLQKYSLKTIEIVLPNEI